jgi:hypothetical protein
LLVFSEGIMSLAEQAPQAGEAAPLVKISNFATKQPKFDNYLLRLIRYHRQREAGRLMPGKPVSWCCRKVAADPQTHRRLDKLPIRQSAASGHYYTAGHWACHSNPCPVCQARRAGAFLGRLLPALEASAARYSYGMDTLTASTHAAMTAGEFIPKFKRAMKSFTGGGWWTRFCDRWHIRGLVTGQDFTQGDHGPHYHVHRLMVIDRKPFWVQRPSRRALNKNTMLAALWWTEPGLETKAVAVMHGIDDRVAAMMFAEAAPRWVECCAAHGLIADLEHGYNVEGGKASAANYIGKLALEVTQSANKRGRGGRTLGELLDDSAKGDCQAGRMWREAIEAMRGSAMLKASPGLWCLLGEAEPSETDLEAGDQTDIDQLIALLPVDDWYAILKDNLREDYFEALCQDDPQALQDFAVRAGVRLLPAEAKSEDVVAADGQTGFVSGRIARVDLDALIGWVSDPVGSLSEGNANTLSPGPLLVNYREKSAKALRPQAQAGRGVLTPPKQCQVKDYRPGQKREHHE